jgi:hypothetical protein
MHPSLARFSGPEASNRTPSLADFITITSGFRFSVHIPDSVYDRDSANACVAGEMVDRVLKLRDR